MKIDLTSHSIDENLGAIFKQAIKLKASDIHIDQTDEGFIVRLRVDGLLYPLEGLDQNHVGEMISKIKVMAEMDIVEKRLPQDGHLEFEYNRKNYNFRVSTIPTINGESISMRMLNREGITTDLSSLGFNESQLETVNKIIYSPFGIALVTGPVGSGKTTFMYSFINKLNKTERSIITIEDPVEYEMANVKQMQINEPIGWSFARGMRAVLRQDPDIIMLGEIRDPETAEMAFQAALTGRLVFSTFHTFDVPGIVFRLIEMGLPRSVIAHSLTGVITTRLVKKVCNNCAVSFMPEEDDLRMLGLPAGQYKFRRGKGCEVCFKSGYSNRIGIFEVVLIDDEMKENIMQEHPNMSLGQLLRQKNFTSLRQNGIEIVLKGVTTPEEIVRVLGY